jgi:sporulation protein YlmC with PRC-barrel domain
MRKIALTAFSVALLSGVSVYAQTTPHPTSPGASPPGATTAAPAPRLAPNPLKQEIVSNIEGTTVYGKDDAKLGSVSEVLMNPDTKKIDKLVVKTGAVLGLGGHQVALPVDQFSWESDKGVLKVSMDQAALKSRPEWVEGAHDTGTGSSTPPDNAVPPSHAGDSQPSAH